MKKEKCMLCKETLQKRIDDRPICIKCYQKIPRAKEGEYTWVNSRCTWGH